MTTLIFNDRGYTIATSSWTMAAGRNDDHVVDIAYLWGADSISFFASATGVSRVRLHISVKEFLAQIKKGGVVDLR